MSYVKDPKLAEMRAQSAFQKYLVEISQARAQALNEGQENKPADAEWIQARGR